MGVEPAAPREDCPLDLSYAAEPNIENSRYPSRNPGLLKRLPKKDFCGKCLKEMSYDVQKHVMGEMFRYEGYQNKVIGIMKSQMDCYASGEKAQTFAELGVAAFKVLKHAINSFWPNRNFLPKFKVNCQTMRNARELAQKPLGMISNEKEVSILCKLRRIHSALAWTQLFLPHFPYFEENFINEALVLGFLRFVNQLLQEIKRNTQQQQQQQEKTSFYLLFEVAGSVLERILHFLCLIFKARNVRSRKEDYQLKKQAGKTEEPTQEQKTERMELFVSILQDCKSFSTRYGQTLILTKNRLGVLLKTLNQIFMKDEQSCQLFVDNGGFLRLISYRVDAEEVKKPDFSREFSELCLNLTKTSALDLVSLECQIKILFWQLPTKRIKLRTFAEKFAEYFVTDSKNTLALIKKLCLIEDLESRKKRNQKKKFIVIKEDQNKEEQQQQRDTMDEFLCRDTSEDLEGLWPQSMYRSRAARESGANNNRECTLIRDDATGNNVREQQQQQQQREKKQSLVVCLRPDIEYSKLYALEMIEENELRNSQNPDYLRKSQGYLLDEPVHILDYKAPKRCRDVLRMLVETIVRHTNSDILEEESQQKKQQIQTQMEELIENQKPSNTSQQQLSKLFPCQVLLQTVQTILGKYPILNSNVLNHNVAPLCRATPPDSYLQKVLDGDGETNQMSFLRYYLRVLVFCTLDTFKNFLLGFCGRTSLIIDKDRCDESFPTPYFFLLKKQIVREIYHTLYEQIYSSDKNTNWLRDNNKVRQFCGASGVLVNIVTLFDIAKMIWENSKEFDFISLYNEGLRQVQATHTEATERVMPYIVDPLSILIQFNLYFSSKKNRKEQRNQDIWMPSEALGASGGFGDEWRRLTDLNWRQSEERLGSVFRIIEESELSDSSREGGLSGSDEDNIDENEASEGEEEDEEEQEEDDNRLHEERTYHLCIQEEFENEEDEDSDDEEIPLEGLGEEDEEEGPTQENLLLDESFGTEIMEEEEEDIEGEENIMQIEANKDNNTVEANISDEEIVQESIEESKEEAPMRCDLTRGTCTTTAHPYPEIFRDNGTFSSQSTTSNPIQLSNHPEIQRINSSFQNNFTDFDQHLSLATSLSSAIPIFSATSQSPFDRIHSRMRSLQTGHHFEESLRRPEFHETFFESNRGRNIFGEEAELEGGGIQIFRSIQEFVDRGPLFTSSQLDNLLDFFSVIESGTSRTAMPGPIPGFFVNTSSILINPEHPLEDNNNNNNNNESNFTRSLFSFGSSLQRMQAPMSAAANNNTNVESFEALLAGNFDSTSAFSSQSLSQSQRRIDNGNNNEEGLDCGLNFPYTEDQAERGRGISFLDPLEEFQLECNNNEPSRAQSQSHRQVNNTGTIPGPSQSIQEVEETTANNNQPTAAEIDEDFLAELPPDLRQELKINFPLVTAQLEQRTQQCCMSKSNCHLNNNNNNNPVNPAQIPQEFISAAPENVRNTLVSLNQNPQHSSSQGSAMGTTVTTASNNRVEIIQEEETTITPRPQNNSQNSSAPLNNRTFIEQLAPELRDEVLQTAEPDFLTSLSPQIQMSERMTMRDNSNSNSCDLGNPRPERIRQRRLASSQEVRTTERPECFMRESPGRVRENRRFNISSSQEVGDSLRTFLTTNTNNRETRSCNLSQEFPGTRVNHPRNPITGDTIAEVASIFENSFSSSKQPQQTGSGSRNQRRTTITPNMFRAAGRPLSRRRNIKKKNFVPDENIIECVLGLLYESEEVFEGFPINLLKSLLSHPSTQHKILQSLVLILTNPNLDRFISMGSSSSSFPGLAIYSKNTFERNYNIVYQKVSLKILFILDYLTRSKSFSFFSLSRPTRSSRSHNKPLRGFENFIFSQTREALEECPLRGLIRLISSPFVGKNISHLKLLLSIIYNITKHCKEFKKTQSPALGGSQNIDNCYQPFRARVQDSQGNLIGGRCGGRPSRCENKYASQTLSIPNSQNMLLPNNNFVLDEELVHILCSCLWNKGVENEVLKKLSCIITTFCRDSENFALFLNELKSAICLRSEKMNSNLSYQTSIITSMLPKVTRMSTFDMSQEYLYSQSQSLTQNQPNLQKGERENLMENLLQGFGMEMDDSNQLYKVLKIMKELFEQSIIETSRKNKKMQDILRDLLVLKRVKSVDALSREEVKRNFQDVLENSALRSLWVNTTDFLNALSQMFANDWTAISPLTQRLQPVLECFFLVYKLLYDEEAYKYYQKGKFITTKGLKKVENVGISRVCQVGGLEEEECELPDPYQEAISEVERENMLSQGLEGPEREMEPEELLRWVCEKSKGVINIMIRQNPELLRGPIAVVMRKFPRILDFDNKRAFFKTELKRLKRGCHRNLKLRVNRSSIFMDSFAQIMARKPHELRGKIVVEFLDEEAVDAGGVAREWFLELSREILNPDYALFKPGAHKTTYQPSPQSCVNSDHLKYFKFVGRVIGKALQDEQLMDCYFTRSFYKHILGQPLTCKDMEDIDPEYYKNLKWILDNDVTGLDLTFSYEAEEFGVIIIKDLIEGGRNLPVTEENKKDYLYKLCAAKMADDIKDQTEAFLEGFHEVIPAELIQIFDSQELELLITGLPDIDVKDLRENTEYQNYTKDSDVIVWLWDIIESFERAQKAAILQFVTGTSKVPVGGFKELRGMGNNHQRFQIHKCYDTSKLPTAHTCFNQLDLPEYRSKEVLKKNLLIAITEGRGGFGFV